MNWPQANLKSTSSSQGPEVRSQLDLLGFEFVEVSKILLPLVELSTGSRPPIEVKVISSSDYATLLQAAPHAAACISQVMSDLVQAYKNILDIRKVAADIRALRIPDTSPEGTESAALLETYASTNMNGAIERIVDRLIDKYAAVDRPEGRDYELKIAVTRSLTALAGRIDDGYSISVRTGPAQPVDESSDDPSGVGQIAAINDLAAEVRGRSQQMTFMNLSGEPILSLPRSTNDVTPDEDSAPADTAIEPDPPATGPEEVEPS